MANLKELRNRTDSKKILVIGGGGNQNGSVSSSLEILESGLLKDNDFSEFRNIFEESKKMNKYCKYDTLLHYIYIYIYIYIDR